MRVSVYHNGVPIGDADLGAGELVVAEFEPNQAYSSVQLLIREASKALWGLGFFDPEAVSSRVPVEVLGRAARLPLELRDEHGKLVPADFVNIVERPAADSQPVVFTRFRHAHAGVPSTLQPPPATGGTTSDPA